jgi:hypothetical protein
MNKRYLTCPFILVWLFCSTSISYACNPTPTPVIDGPDTRYVSAGETVYFHGEYPYYSHDNDEGGFSITEYEWNFPSADYVTDEETGSPIVRWDSPGGPYEVELMVKDDEGYWSVEPDTCTVYVIKVDLDIVGVSEGDEDDPGGYIAVNTDDDNKNSTQDRDSVETTVDNEDDLVEISSLVLPSMDTGEVKLEATACSGNIKVWYNSNKGAEVTLPKTWDLSTEDVNTPLYVEGINASDSPRDVELRLSFTKDATTCDDKVRFTVLEVQVFRDSAYTNTLDDWPESGSDPRSPKYIFGEDDPIYVQVKNLGTDPYTAETIYDAVMVTSESYTGDIVKLNLWETGANTQIFNNSVYPGELLYLSTSSSEGGGDKIKVIDEEVLTFSLEIQPDSDNYVSCYRVMVDRAEVGVEWQCDYYTYDTGYSTLGCADDFAQGFYNQLGTVDQVWFKNFDNGDLNSKESHWDSGGDSDYADSVDIAVWCGHGPVDTNPYMRFFVDKIGGVKQPADKLYWSEIDWGDKDMDWVVLNTCSFLNGTDNELKGMASGVHLICGYKTDMTIYCNAGDYFADRLDDSGKTIKQAWFDQADEYQAEEDENTARVFGASACMSDSPGSTGPIQISRDPTSSSTYTHEDHDCF